MIKDGNTDEEQYNLLKVASLCEIKCYNGNFVTLECVGRIKLDGCAQLSPYWRFYFSSFEEIQDHLNECRLVADNVETFIRNLSKSESNDDDEEQSLLCRFKRAYDRCYKIIDNDVNNNDTQYDHDIRSLTAISWAVFSAMDEKESSSSSSTSMNLHNYRLRALDYGTLFDRLKLAQYMLREKELRLQGNKMMLKEDGPMTRETTDDVNAIKDQWLEGFQ